jgi:hypothetical protein
MRPGALLATVSPVRVSQPGFDAVPIPGPSGREKETVSHGKTEGGGRGLSIQRSKGRYEYFYCLGQKNRAPTGCREPYVAAESLEAEVENLYRVIHLPKAWLAELHGKLEAEIGARQRRNASERELISRAAMS